ncbi:serine/threonine-protein kinase PksC [Acrasis kona]|uniref:Serine/threonine-protein kinase PksC n=1 Tax=Acrasis kona TaxID=1008807 RepID=A0AAW2ZKP0_9EUKA
MEFYAWYEPISVLHTSKHSQVLRARYKAGKDDVIQNGTNVIIKTHTTEYTSLVTAEHFRREYNIGKIINSSENSSNVVRYLSLLEKKTDAGQAIAIVIEDYTCKSLLSIIPQGGFDVATFLNHSIQITKGLLSVHDCRIVHKDIKPSNIIIDDNSHIMLIDFGCASQLQEEVEKTPVKSIQRIYGTLAYVSPEQTGRINRTIDFRSDFYSLGITFYQLLSGKLPFQTNEIMKLVYCHIASKLPPLPSHLPKVIVDIINKLTMKDCEDRYQSCKIPFILLTHNHTRSWNSIRSTKMQGVIRKRSTLYRTLSYRDT